MISSIRTATLSPKTRLISSKDFLAVYISEKKKGGNLGEVENDPREEEQVATDKDETEFPGDCSNSDRGALNKHDRNTESAKETKRKASSSSASRENLGSVGVWRCLIRTSENENEYHNHGDAAVAPH